MSTTGEDSVFLNGLEWNGPDPSPPHTSKRAREGASERVQEIQRERKRKRKEGGRERELATAAHLFCSSSLARSSTSSGLSWAEEGGERPAEEREVEEDVCRVVGGATVLAI